MIVSEHEAMPTPIQGVNSQQPETDQNIVKRVNELLQRAKRFRKRLDQEWHYNYEFVIAGKQWPVERPRWRFNECVNLTWSSVMTEIGIQTDARPKFEFNSQEPSDETFMKALKDINDRNWDRYGWNSVVQDALFDCKLYHVGHASVEWDEDLDAGLGDVCFKMLDPFYCYWDPIAEDLNRGKRARYFIYAEPIPVTKLKDKYPEKAEYIKPDVDYLSDRFANTGTTLGRQYTNYDPYSPSRLPSQSSGSSERFGGEPMALLIRCWLRDETLEQVEEEKENGEKEYALKKRYPTGRYIEMASNTLLFDDVPGCWIQKQWVPYIDPYCPDAFPIEKIVNYSYAREYAGENEVTHTRGPQKMMNYIWSYILDCFRIAANPINIISSSSGIDPERVTNEPGLNIETNDMAGFRREYGQAIAPQSMDLLSRAESFFDKVQGLQDVSRGAEQAGVNSGIMLEGYIEAAQTRPRLKNRNLEEFLQQVGQRIAARYLQFYDKPRTMRITNDEGFPEYVEFYFPTNEEGKKIAKLVRLKTDGSGQIVTSEIQTSEIKGIPDIRVVSGSALPFAKAQKSTNALQALQAGAIDQEEYLKIIDWPNYQSVLERMKQAAPPPGAEGAGAPPGAPPPGAPGV